MKKKKIIIIILIVAAVAIFGVGGYIIYLAQKNFQDNNVGLPSDQLTETALATPTPVPTFDSNLDAESSKLKEIISGNILAFWPSATTTVQFISTEGFGEADYSYATPKVTKKDLGVTFDNVLDIWPSKYGKVLIQYVASGASQAAFSVLDIGTKALKNLDQNIKSATWSPDGKYLAFYYSNSSLYYKEDEKSEQYLGQFDKDLANKKVLTNFSATSDLILSWPTSTKIYISQKPSGLVNQSVLLFDTKTKLFSPFTEANGLILKWNQSGSYGLLFSTGDNGLSPSLKVINKDAIILGSFPKAALPEKCVFSQIQPVVYCAITNDLKSGVVWPDDYYQGAFKTYEAIYKINLQSLEAEPIISQFVFEVDGIGLSLDESNLIFYDKSSQKLYAYPI